MSKEFHRILESVVNEDLRRTFETLFSKVVCQTNETIQPEMAEALRLLRTLLEHGFKETPSVVFLIWLDSFSALTLDEVLSVAPNPICFSRWLKKSKVLTQEIQRQLAERPDQTYATIGADWLLEHSKPEASLPVYGPPRTTPGQFFRLFIANCKKKLCPARGMKFRQRRPRGNSAA